MQQYHGCWACLSEKSAKKMIWLVSVSKKTSSLVVLDAEQLTTPKKAQKLN